MKISQMVQKIANETELAAGEIGYLIGGEDYTGKGFGENLRLGKYDEGHPEIQAKVEALFDRFRTGKWWKQTNTELDEAALRGNGVVHRVREKLHLDPTFLVDVMFKAFGRVDREAYVAVVHGYGNLKDPIANAKMVEFFKIYKEKGENAARLEITIWATEVLGETELIILGYSKVNRQIKHSNVTVDVSRQIETLKTLFKDRNWSTKDLVEKLNLPNVNWLLPKTTKQFPADFLPRLNKVLRAERYPEVASPENA